MDRPFPRQQEANDREPPEERHRQELDHLQAILDAIPAPIFYKDAEGAYRGCNRAFEAYLGRTRDQIVGKTVYDVAPPDLADVYRRADLELFQTRDVQIYETSVRYADGTRHDVVFNKATYLDRDGTLAGLVGTMLDITERKRAEKALRESEERLHLALEGTNDGLFDWSAASGHVYVGPQLWRLLGYAPDEMPRDPAGLLRLLHPDDHPRALRQLQAHLAGRTTQYESEHRVASKDGEWKWLLVRGKVAERASDGTALRLVGTYRDITEKKKLQAQLEFAARMSAVGELAAGVAHEMNNPLMYVLANLQYAVDELARANGPGEGAQPALAEALHALIEAREGAERVRTIVQDLKAFSRQDRGETPVRVDVRAVLQSVLKMARAEIRHRATVALDLGEVPPVMASEQRLGQVFLNLLVNAAQAIPEGNASGNQIRVATRLEGDRVVVEVQDTGAGMPPQVRERIFDPFFTTKPAGVGTGLGLTICHGIVAGLGGDIQVDSEVGVGTTFRVRFPASASSASDRAPVGEGGSAVTARGSPPRIRKIP